MSDSQKILGVEVKKGQAEQGGPVKKLTFTPPILHKYGEVVKICQANPDQGQGDFYTQSS